jgi:hypothetical protein
MGNKQVETLTVLGTVTLNGNATVTVTGNYVTNSPVVLSVAVLNADTPTLVAGKVRPAMALSADISAAYAISGAGADVVLTDRVARANDTTLLVSITNDTCTGLTPATSVNTLAGDGTLNGYCTLQQVKDMLNPKGLTTLAVDDSFIEMLINFASRYIDTETNDVFYATTSTRNFDSPRGYGEILFFDLPNLSVTTVTNGDGTLLPSTAYVLLPANVLPKYGMQLLCGSGFNWAPDNGSPQQAISIFGSWGNSAAPADIVQACISIVVAAYRRRTGENQNSKTLITAAGAVLMPEDVPGIAADVINNHRRNAIG